LQLLLLLLAWLLLSKRGHPPAPAGGHAWFAGFFSQLPLRTLLLLLLFLLSSHLALLLLLLLLLGCLLLLLGHLLGLLPLLPLPVSLLLSHQSRHHCISLRRRLLKVGLAAAQSPLGL
jgi:hypothetical protein